MISVCVATYNGEAFVEEQLASILKQLSCHDEVVICDDGSKDKTLQIINNINDHRIRLFLNEHNLGHVANFERLITLARGDIIFLSDQDDIWVPGKVGMAMNFFTSRSDVLMYHHGYGLIDINGQEIEGGTRWRTGLRFGIPFLFREFIKPTLFGSCLAFRKPVIDLLIPFPKVVYAHDHWATIIGALAGGIFYDSNPLVRRRIHGSNLSPDRGLGVMFRLRVRILYLTMFFSAGFRLMYRKILSFFTFH